ECERLVAESGLPWTILRATQFYDYMLTNLRRLAKLPVVPVPSGFQVKPVDPEEVAAKLAELALGEPAGRVPEMAGPVVSSWADLLRDYVRASGKRRWVVPVPIPGTGAVRRGGLLPGPDHTAGTRTWQQFLAEALRQPQAKPTPGVSG
ncbi:MAG: NAD-dependent epimerase/dehydratase family protein, partial [Candidatus Dormibacteraeota bacterium]|nr:NAD-dependent epimerase/dehydratase family protein [Candidatus Dormibacteraeota bacterium]